MKKFLIKLPAKKSSDKNEKNDKISRSAPNGESNQYAREDPSRGSSSGSDSVSTSAASALVYVPVPDNKKIHERSGSSAESNHNAEEGPSRGSSFGLGAAAEEPTKPASSSFDKPSAINKFFIKTPAKKEIDEDCSLSAESNQGAGEEPSRSSSSGTDAVTGKLTKPASSASNIASNALGSGCNANAESNQDAGEGPSRSPLFGSKTMAGKQSKPALSSSDKPSAIDTFFVKLAAKKAIDEDSGVRAESDQGVGEEPLRGPSFGSGVETGKVPKRRFVPGWKVSFPWIFYDSMNDVAFCSICREIFLKTGLPFSTKKDMVFIESGFSNWKKGVEKFKTHEGSICHKEAVSKWHSLKAGVNVYAEISDQKKNEMISNRACLKKIFSSILYLARQGLAIRGHDDDKSNFSNLLNLRGEDSRELQLWLKRESYTWCSHGVQNEMLDLLSHSLLRRLIGQIKEATFFAIICDETADISRKEQFSFCVRFVTSSLEVEELFLGFYETESTTSSSLYSISKDALVRFSMLLSNCRGQCYDGAKNMSGCKNGVQAKILDDEKRALYVHCVAHSLNLVAQDAIKTIPICRDSLNLVKDMINFVRDSPKRLAIFQTMKSADSTNLRPLCPTRWTVRHHSLSSILSNYSALVEFFTTLAENDPSDSGAKASGFLRMLEKFDFYFILTVMVKIFGFVDTVNTALQKKSLRLEEAHRMIDTLKASLNFCRKDFTAIWTKLMEDKPEEVGSPKPPRKRKVPKRYQTGEETTFAASIEETNETLFKEIIDKVLESLVTRFDTESFLFSIEVEQFLLGDDANKEKIINFYDTDVDGERLLLQRDIFLSIINENGTSVENSSGIADFIKTGSHLIDMLPEFVKFLRIFLTIPVSSSTAERSFSGLRRLKTYLRSTMGQQRLNSIALLHCHKELAKELDLEEIVDEFIGRSSQRQNTFYMQRKM